MGPNSMGGMLGTIIGYSSVLVSELYDLIGPTPFMFLRAAFLGFGALSLIASIIPRAYGFGPYKHFRFVHFGRLIQGVILVLLGVGLLLVEPRGGFYG